MKFVIDIDGTICSERKSHNYNLAKPKEDRIATINKLYDDGHKIVLFTARGSETGIDWSELTLEQLKEWGVKFHDLQFGKPSGDIYFDDRLLEPFWLEKYKELKSLFPIIEDIRRKS